MKRLSPLQAIRKKCLECMVGSPSEVEACTANVKDISESDDPGLFESCSLYEFRLGKNPARAGIGNKKSPLFYKKTGSQLASEK